MSNAIKVWFSGFRLIDIGDETIDSITSQSEDMSELMDMDYFYEEMQVNLVADADADLPIDFV